MRQNPNNGKYEQTPADIVEAKKAKQRRYQHRRKIKRFMLRNQLTIEQLIAEETYAR